MKIGYIRISTDEQKMDLQEDDLKRAGCEKIFYDTASGAKTDRKGLEEAIQYAREGDTIVVWKLDRLGRSLKHLIDVVNELTKRGISFHSLKESMDTSTSGGKLIFHVFGALAEFERDIIRERTIAGLASARSRGRMGGRPAALDEKKIKMALDLLDNRDYCVDDVCQILKVHKSTLYRHFSKNKELSKSHIREARIRKMEEKLNA